MKTYNILGFKNATLFLVLMFALVSSSMSQQPQYYNHHQNAGSTENVYPFAIPSGKEVQWLFLAGDFNQPSRMPSGNITAIYIYMTNTVSNTLTSLTVKMGLSTITSLPTGAIYAGQLDTVYYRASVTLNAVVNEWMSITLDRPFAYNNTMSLILDISQCAATTTVMFLRQDSVSGVRRTYINAASCFFSYGAQDRSVVDLGLDVDTLVGIQPLGYGIPYVYRLAQNYPNPFNPSTKIAFDIPKAGFVNMVVYDLPGGEVATLVNEFKQAGKYDVDFNGLNLASGIYFYKITAGDFVETKKMLLIK